MAWKLSRPVPVSPSAARVAGSFEKHCTTEFSGKTSASASGAVKTMPIDVVLSSSTGRGLWPASKTRMPWL
jgi:hypothetical protein